jgi:hypothetical protein
MTKVILASHGPVTLEEVTTVLGAVAVEGYR